jgi:protein-L-isoaspartate(D-aspartate) O-methyltransferase
LGQIIAKIDPQLYEALRGTNIQLQAMDTPAALEEVRAGRADAMIEFTEQGATVTVEGSDPTRTSSFVNQMAAALTEIIIGSPLRAAVTVKYLYGGPGYTLLDYLAPVLIALSLPYPLSLSLLLAFSLSSVAPAVAAAPLATQLSSRGIRDARVLAAFAKVPRDVFVAAEAPERAFDDKPLPGSLTQTISQPYLLARMVEELQLKPGARVLEVGSGTGYPAAILSEIAAEVFSVGVIPELASTTRLRLAREGYQNVHVKLGDGALGWREYALRCDRRHLHRIARAVGPGRSVGRRRRLGDAGRATARSAGAAPRDQEGIQAAREGGRRAACGDGRGSGRRRGAQGERRLDLPAERTERRRQGAASAAGFGRAPKR